jgi:hypothetical protein
MKKSIIILLVLFAQISFGQNVVKLTDGEPAYIPNYLIIEGNLYFKNTAGYTSLGDTLYGYVSKADSTILFYTHRQIDSILAINNTFDGNLNITRTDWPVGEQIGGTTIKEVLNNLLYPSVPPTSTISSSLATTQEYMADGTDLSVDLLWTATRPEACLPIISILVDGVSQILDSPFDEGHTQSGTLTGRSLPRNIQTSYIIEVNSEDKSNSSSVTIVWRWKRYWGAFASAVPPTDGSFTITDADILALTGAGIGTGSEFATSRQKNYNGINGAGNYLVFAFPSSWGTPTFKINGLTSTAFTKVRDDIFVNASGGSNTYQVWVTNSEMNSPISEFEIE